MASRVNTKFVIMLVSALVAVLAVAVGLYIGVVRKSADDFITLGDQQMAQGAYSQAVSTYGRAVRREQNNPEYLRKWIGAMEKTVPATETVFRAEFGKYLSAKSALANALATDIAAPEEYLDLLWSLIEESPYQRGEIDNLAAQTTQAVRYFSADPPQPGDAWATLLRYRGLANVQTMLEGADIDRETTAQTRADLEAALAANPDDREAAIGLGLFHAASAVIAGRESRRTDQSNSIDAGLAVYDSFLATHPDDPFVRLEKLLLTMDRIAMEVRLSGETEPDAQRALFEQKYSVLREGFGELAAAMRDHPNADHLDATRFEIAESRLFPGAQAAMTREILRAQLDRDPENPLIIMRLGQMQMTHRLYEEAAETMEAVAKIREKPIPLGLEGFMRFGAVRNATYLEARAVIRLAGLVREQITDEIDPAVRETLEAKLTEFLTQADEVVERFRGLTIPDDPQTIRLAAERAYISRNYEEAQNLLRQYNERVSFQDPETLWWTGQTAVRMNQIGRAREAFEQARAVAPEQHYITIALGELEMKLNEHERALELFESVLRDNPSMELAKTQAIQLREMLGITRSEDPARQLVLDATRIVRGTAAGPGDKTEAIELLLDGLPSVGYNPIVAREAARYLVDLDRMSEAAEVLAQSRQRFPDDAELAALADILANPDSVDAKVQLIARADLPEADRIIGTYQLYRNAGRTEEAIAVLDQAIEVAPNDPLVIESAFLRALSSPDQAGAQAWVDRAKATNADQVGGATFESRLLFSKGDRERAVTLLKSITSAEVAPASAYRLLGAQLLALGEPQQAAEAFARSIEIMPNQPVTLLEYLRALVQSNQMERALGEARRLQRQGSGSSDFVNAWLDLEARDGDLNLALERREERLIRDPSDRKNREALARLYIEIRRWNSAEALILGLREEGDSLDLVRLNAEYHADQGQAARAREIYSDHITTLDPISDRDAYVRAHLDYARFMMTRSAFADAIAAIESIREFQDPTVLSADRLLAEIHAAAGNLDQALTTQLGIVAAGADDDEKQYLKRAIDTMIRLGRLDEASERLARASAESPRDVVFLVQKGEIEKQRREFAAARRTLDQAIAINPGSELGYIKRAELMLAEYITSSDENRRATLVQDALADLDEAIRIRPESWVAVQLRAQTYFTVGRIDEAVAEFRSALQLQPDQDALRQRLMIELIGLKRYDDAVFLATDAINNNPGVLGLIVRMSRVFSERGLWNEAASVIRLGWETTRDETFGAFYCDALLNATPPRVDEARAVLGTLRDLNANINGSAALLVLQAVILGQSGRTADASEMMIRAFEACNPERPGDFGVWYNNLPRVFPDRPGDHVRLIENAIQRVGATTPAGGWGQLLLTQGLVAFEPRKAEGLSRLRLLAENTSNPPRSVQSWLELGAAQLESNPEAAVAVWQEGLGLHPEEWRLMNNTAFTMAKRLKKPAEALPIAERAVELAPDSADTTDTLALVHYMLGMEAGASSTDGAAHLARAEELLTKAGDLAATLQTAATVLYHQTLIAIARGDSEQVQIRGQRFVRQIEASPSLRKAFEEELVEIKSALGQS